MLPPHDYASINGTRAWDRATIVKWGAETKRIKPGDALWDEVPTAIRQSLAK